MPVPQSSLLEELRQLGDIRRDFARQNPSERLFCVSEDVGSPNLGDRDFNSLEPIHIAPDCGQGVEVAVS
jgi:hypothetical protein